MNQDFSRWMQAKIDHINPILLSHFSANHFSIAPKMTAATLYPLQTGGKRIRPLFVYAAAEAFDITSEQKTYCDVVAKAIEFVHTYSLVHDDLPCMDDDDERRGKPTVHKVYQEGPAVLIGDSLLTEAFASCCQLPPKILHDVLPILSKNAGIGGMIGGQSLDIGFEKEIASVEDLEVLHGAKTGALIQCAVEMGGICVGVSLEQRKILRLYGQLVGLAFQLADDVLDAEEDAEKNKIGEGPPNFVAFLGVEETRKRSQSYIDEAISLVDEFPYPKQLQQLARFTIDRTF